MVEDTFSKASNLNRTSKMASSTLWILLILNLLQLPTSRSQEEITCPKGFVIFGEKSYLRNDAEAVFCLVCKTNSAFAEIVEVCQDFGFFDNLKFSTVSNTPWTKAKPEGSLGHELSCDHPGWTLADDKSQILFECSPFHTKTTLKFSLNRNFTDLADMFHSRVYSSVVAERREIQVFGPKALSCPSQEKVQEIFVTLAKGQPLAQLRLCIKCDVFLICTSSTSNEQPWTELAFSLTSEEHFFQRAAGVCGITYDHEHDLENLMESIDFLKCLHPQLSLNALQPPNVTMTLITVGGALLFCFILIGLALVATKKIREHFYMENLSNTLHGIEPERRATWIPNWKLGSNKVKRNTYFAPTRAVSERSEDYEYNSEYSEYSEETRYLPTRITV